MFFFRFLQLTPFWNFFRFPECTRWTARTLSVGGAQHYLYAKLWSELLEYNPDRSSNKRYSSHCPILEQESTELKYKSTISEATS
jgi:hypothetical protein